MEISESLKQVLASNKIIGESFYGIFLDKYPEVQTYFEDVNLKRQGVVVTMALTVIEQYYSNPYLATKRFLQYLGQRHRKLGIPQELYANWSDTMLETLEKFHGSDFTPELRDQWRDAIGRTTELMFEGYQEGFQPD